MSANVVVAFLQMNQFDGLRRKVARWWDRLGGRPVDHAASPRFVSCQNSLISLS